MGLAWVSGLTYIRTTEGWLYLTTVIVLYDRTVIGWALSTNMTANDTSMAARKMAVRNRPVTKDLIFHSDKGVQYACADFIKLLKVYPKVRQSIACPEFREAAMATAGIMPWSKATAKH